MHSKTITAIMGLLASLDGVRAGMYAKSSPVIQVDAKSYDKLIAKSNYTSIVEFYAPWCGHCQNLKPAYEKAAKSLAGLAQVAAIDCDDDANKALCGTMGVQGFPTLKIVRPSHKKPGVGRPGIEPYDGQRSATAIVDAVISKINNHVKKVTDSDADDFLGADGPKALLFSEKGTATPLLKSLAIEFLGVMPVGQVRKKDSATLDKFGVTKFPTLVLIPGGDAEPQVYDGEMKKPAMVEFLSKAANPSSKRSAESAPQPNPSNPKSSKPNKAADEPTKASSAGAGADARQTAPVVLDVPPVPTLTTPERLTEKCLGSKSHTCVLVFLPEGESAHGKAHKALETLARSAHRHAQGNHVFFPFYAVTSDNAAGKDVLAALDLKGEVEIVAINARRGWWRHYDGDFGTSSVESWIDTIRMGDGVKNRLPEGLVEEVEDNTANAEEEAAETPAAASSEHDEL